MTDEEIEEMENLSNEKEKWMAAQSQYSKDQYKRIINMESTLRAAGVSEQTILKAILEMCHYQIARSS
jgi:DNA primase large subunit